jgi:hypothetical protein
MATVFNTNKEIAIVRPTEAFVAWLSANDLGMLIAKVRATAGYFLTDSPFAEVSPVNGVYPQEERHKQMLGWFKRVFESELATAGVPENLWPDTSSIGTFQRFFSVEYCLLEADLGTLPLQTRAVPL